MNMTQFLSINIDLFHVPRYQSRMRNMTCEYPKTWPTSLVVLTSLLAVNWLSRWVLAQFLRSRPGHHENIRKTITFSVWTTFGGLSQVLERDGWMGLEEVTRMINGHEFAVTGECQSLRLHCCCKVLHRSLYETQPTYGGTRCMHPSFWNTYNQAFRQATIGQRSSLTPP